MNEFKAALSAFQAGQIGFDQVDLVLARSLQADPSVGPMAFAAIDQVYRGGRLPLQLYVALKNRIAQSHAAAADRGAPPAQPPPRPQPQPPQPPPTWQAPQQPQPQPTWQAPQQPQQPQPQPTWQAPQQPQPPPTRQAPPPAQPQPTWQAPQPPAPPPSYAPPAARQPPDSVPAAPPRAAPEPPQRAAPEPPAPRAAPPSAPAAPPPPSAAAPEGGGDRTIMRGRAPSRPAPDASQPHSAPPGDPSVRDATGGFRQAQTPVGDPTGQTGGPFTSRTGNTSATGTGNSSWTDASKWSDQPAQVLERGSVLKGRFVLENVVGRGGMGVVFRAKDLRKEEAQDRDPYVAIKILNDEFRRHPESLKALQRESRKSQTLAHPNIVNVYDFDRDGGTVYMTMEFLEGEALDRTIKNPQFEGMALEDAYPIIEGLGRALSYAHGKGIVHSDFKPGNCFLTKSGVVKVFDFGIAQAAKMQGSAQGELTKFDAGTLGALTPAYASWEMIEGQQPDQRDDIYALGCVIYELLTGKHPFAKKSAKEARDEKLVPPLVKQLNRRQQRALQKAVAFQRADRSASVEELVGGLGKQASNPAKIAIGVAAVLIVAVVGYFGMLQWQAQQTGRLIEALESADDSRVPAALEDLNSHDALEKNNILQQVREPLLDWYEQRMKRAANVAEQRYDYTGAKAILDQAEVWYPDSAKLGELRSQLTDEQNELLADLEGRFTENLQAGRLLPTDNDDVSDVLAIMSQLQPDHEMLRDPQLAFAYAKQAETELVAKRLAPAGSLLDLGLERFPDDAGLRNLRDKLNVELGAEQTAQRVAELKQTLAPVQQARTLDDLRGLAQPAAELARLSPNDAVLGVYRQRLGPALDSAVQMALDARDWDGAQRLIDGVADFLSPEAQTNVRNRVATARGNYDTRTASLVAALTRAADEGRMNVAQDALGDLEELGADEVTIRDARSRILGGYIAAVQELMVARRFDDANAAITAGLAFEQGSARLLEMRDAIVQQRASAEQQDRAAAEEQRVAQANALRTSLQAALGQTGMTMAVAERAVADADKLALVAPDDPLAGKKGHERVAAALATQALEMGGRNQRDQALALLGEARGLIGDSASLEDARADIVRAQEEDRVRQGEQRLAQQQQSLDALLDTPRYDAAWVTEVRNLVAAIGKAAPANDARLAASQQKAGGLLVTRAGQMRQEQRFDEATRMLEAARGFAAGLPALAAEQQALAEAQERARNDTEQKQRAAKVEGLKRNFMARVNANSTSEANAILDELRRELPASDEYLTTTAPQALASIYLRLARVPFGQGDLDRAQQLVDEGLRQWSSSPDLLKLKKDIADARVARAAAPVPAPTTTAPAPVTPAPTLPSGGSAPSTGSGTAPATGSGGAPATGSGAAPATGGTPTTRDCTAELAGRGSDTRAFCFDSLSSGGRGPALVVVPAGGGFSASFAIGRTEVSVEQWNTYCRVSTRCPALPGEPVLPATNVTGAAMEEYAAWLSQQSGKVYRLPTRDEWLYAASAVRTAGINVNCLTPRTGKGERLLQVGSDNGNSWGIRDYVGNARELVKTGAGYEARGGDYRVGLEQCKVDRAEAHDGSADAFTGFRLVRDMGAGR